VWTLKKDIAEGWIQQSHGWGQSRIIHLLLNNLTPIMGEDPTKKISFNIICEPFTQANDNLFPYDSQSQNDNILLKI